MKANMHLETLRWLDKQIDDINAKSELIGELLMEETDKDLVKKLDKKLAQYEKELDDIAQKIEFEKKILNS
jgi:hypothetical protein